MLISRIVENKTREVTKRRRKVPLKALKSRITDASQANNFKESISWHGKTNIIAEIKQFSPSAGTLVRDFNPGRLATIYEDYGASAISILMDKRFFGGDLENIVEVRRVCSLPILAKEFIIDESNLTLKEAFVLFRKYYQWLKES